MGSTPIQVAIYRNASVAQSVEQRTENPRVDGSIPSGGTKNMLHFAAIAAGGPSKYASAYSSNADLAHLVERHLAKVEVASSNLVTRSIVVP